MSKALHRVAAAILTLLLFLPMQGSIWRIRLGDTRADELTAAATYDSSPTWSPDGKWIVYTAE